MRRLGRVGVGDGHHVGVGVAFRVADGHRRQVGGALGARHCDDVADRRRLHPPGLAREPPPLWDVAQERALQPLLRAPDERGFPPTDGPHLRQRRRCLRAVALDRRHGARLHREPVEGVRAEGQEVRVVADHGHLVAAEKLDGDEALPRRQVQLDRLQEAGKVGDAEDLLRLVAAYVSQDLAVLGPQQIERAPAERAVPFAQRDQALGPRVHRVRVALLRLDVDRLVVVLGVGDDRQIEALPVRAREAGVAIRAPLHRRPYAVPVAEEDVVTHPDLVAVVEDRRAGQREQEPIHQLDPAPVVAQQRREPAADAEVQPREPVLRVRAVHVVALLVGHHLERQLVVVAEEQRPLRALGDRRRLGEDVDDREAVLHADRHEQPWHEREMEGHVALVAGAEVGDRVLGPLVRLGEQHAVAVVGVDVLAKVLQERVRLGQVLTVGALTLIEVRDRVETHAVDAHVHPEVECLEDRLVHLRVVVVEVRLAGVEPVPEVRVRDVVPRPVGSLEVLEDDADVLVALVRLAPDVEVSLRAAGFGPPRALKPRVLVGRVVGDELVDDPDASPVGLADHLVGVAQRAVHRIDVVVVGDVISVVAHGRRVEGQQPDRVDAEVLQVRELLEQAAEVAASVRVAVHERAHVELIDERVLVPERVVVELRKLDLLVALGGSRRCDHRKYSKSCSLRTRRRKRKICPGIEKGFSSTKLRGPFHR